MLLYVIRHGQTNWNLEKKLQGRTNTLLTETGIKQAEKVARLFENIDADFILSSPLQRALDTANIINKNKNLSIIIEPQLVERSFGDFEGLDDISKFDCSIDKLLDYNLNYDLHNVEPIQSLFVRVSELLESLITKYEDKRIILCTHGGVIQVLHCILKNLPKETNLQALSLANCEFRTYDISSKNIINRKDI